MVGEGLIEADGITRSRAYRLKPLADVKRLYPRLGLQEDLVWRELIAPLMTEFAKDVRDIWRYACTEMINNAIDHSGSPEVEVSVQKNALYSKVVVADQGVGIFLKIQKALGLHDPREAILELAKGKLTTAPEHHSGEGIFFTSRIMDVFEIASHNILFTHVPRKSDVIAEQVQDMPGTRIRLRLDNDSPKKLNDVFELFQDAEELTFDKTVVPLRLAQFGDDKLVSRSQAKRIVQRFERFKKVELDFAGVEDIGQAFADEMFRVFVGSHPSILVVPVNANDAVSRMIQRVLNTARTNS
jgi:anti-sigma regulatory factor (Ser/Thr protein kinase)